MRILIKQAVVLAVTCCSTLILAQQNAHRLSPAERQHVLDGDFKLILKTEAIPDNIKSAYLRLSRQPSFAMAEPGQKYQVGDVVVNRSLPFRRLIFAGNSEKKWFIQYERGGRGHTYYVAIFVIDPDGGARFAWGGSGANGAKNLDQLRKMVTAGQFSDEYNYYW
jgi:hypothetical protein